MPPFQTPSILALFAALLLCSGLARPGPAGAQTAMPSPADPAVPGAAAAPRRVVRAVKPDSTLPAGRRTALPKPTAAERAEKRKLDHDLNICIGC